MQTQGKSLLTHCPSVVPSETRHAGQCQLCTSVLLALSQSVSGCLLSDLPKMVTLPLSLQPSRSPPLLNAGKMSQLGIPRRSYPSPV